MQKLKLTDIHKSYRSGEVVHALKGVSLEFRENEFVSILGPSGCGKTTLLNIIGGLDRYDKGDITLGGMSTKDFKDADWDAYRNRSIGFVFQNYNLIGHQTVLQNVEIAMTLSGVSASERRSRAKEALKSVGLSDQIKKKPTQLSGGQMQRVAIARALVNNPEIILADEPTGALDSQTSVQLMDILKEISKTRLVIMVTHNGELAKEYSSRIITLLDGELQSDSNPMFKDNEKKKQEVQAGAANKGKLKKTSMSMFTAASLSFKNLLTKKGRTAITSFAGSIGIIGVALVLALSAGLSGYMSQIQEDSLSSFPITITDTPQQIRRGMDNEDGRRQLLVQTDEVGKFPEDDIIHRYNSDANTIEHTNILTQEFFDYIAEIEAELPDAVSMVSYSRGVDINLLARGESSIVKYVTKVPADQSGNAEEALLTSNPLYWEELYGNEELSLLTYDLIGDESRLPREINEVAIVVDEYNRIDTAFFEKLGMFTETDNYALTDFIGATILKVIPNDDYYSQTSDGLFIPALVSDYETLYDSENGIELTITGILRKKESSSSLVSYTGLVYTTALTEYIVDNANNSEIAIAQRNSETNVVLNTPFASDSDRANRLLSLGADTTPTGISIYPKDYDGKEEITRYIDAYNIGKAEREQIVYNDMAQLVKNMIGTTLDTVTYVLTGFAAISLVVSTLMIAIITYVSVLERTKEIGILRSVGARKKDISRVFNAEAVIIGLVAGLFGVVLSYLLSVPINRIIYRLVGIEGIANLPSLFALLLVLGSMALTLIAGFIPSRMAAQKDPVEALRTE